MPLRSLQRSILSSTRRIELPIIRTHLQFYKEYKLHCFDNKWKCILKLVDLFLVMFYTLPPLDFALSHNHENTSRNSLSGLSTLPKVNFSKFQKWSFNGGFPSLCFFKAVKLIPAGTGITAKPPKVENVVVLGRMYSHDLMSEYSAMRRNEKKQSRRNFTLYLKIRILSSWKSSCTARMLWKVLSLTALKEYLGLSTEVDKRSSIFVLVPLIYVVLMFFLHLLAWVNSTQILLVQKIWFSKKWHLQYMQKGNCQALWQLRSAKFFKILSFQAKRRLYSPAIMLHWLWWN